VIAGGDRTGQIVDAAAATLGDTFARYGLTVRGLAFSPHGTTRATTCMDGAIRL
jgi:hypothetical protein